MSVDRIRWWFLVMMFLSPAVLIMETNVATAQRVASRVGDSTGDIALKQLEDQLQEAGREWIEKYRSASSDEERAALQRNSSYRQFEPRFLAHAKKYPGHPSAMIALQWLAKNANPGPDFDAGLDLVRRHHLEDVSPKRILVPVFRRDPAEAPGGR